MIRARTTMATTLLLCFMWMPVHAQSIAAEILAGGREFGDGTGMMSLELRAGIAPRSWPVRPTLGLAAATDFYSSQLEATLGVQADLRSGRLITLSGGGGISRLSQQGGEWNSGSSVGPYLNGAVLVSPPFLRGFMFGLDARYLSAPAFTRKDGLQQEVSFLQLSLVVALRVSQRSGREDAEGH